MRRKFFIFIVDQVVPCGPDRLTILGRCGDYPIHVHDEFDQIFMYQRRKLPEEAGRRPIRDVVKQVSLRVVCIHAYDQSLPELSQAMTGSILLEGDGLDLVAPNWILGTFDDQPPRRLESLAPADQTTAV